MSFCDPYVWAVRKKQSGVEGGGDKANGISTGLGFFTIELPRAVM